MAKKAVSIPVPRNLEEANYLLVQLGEIKRQIAETKNGLKDQMTALRTAANEEIGELEQLYQTVDGTIKRFATEHRKELLKGTRTKLVRLSGGVIRWYNSPVRVETELSDDELLAKVEKRRKGKYVRTIRKPNRRAMIEDTLPITGVAYVQEEILTIQPTPLVPSNTEIEP